MRCYTFDPAGNPIERQDAVPGQTVTYSWNDLYFLSERLYAPSGAADTFTYDLSGRMLTNQRQNGLFKWAESFTYDGANRLTQTIQNTGTVQYTYNIPGRTRMVAYPGGRTITEYTDARARLDHINTSPSLVQYTYDAANNMLGRNYSNGTTSSYTYNADNWLTGIAHQNPSTFAGFTYTYDNEGNRLNELKTPNTSQSECYGYDTTYRLISYQSGTPGSPGPCPVASPAPTQTSYTLDPLGNWNSKTTNGVTQTRVHNTVNEITQINSTPLTYDNDGDLANDGTYAYQYDEEHRLTEMMGIGASVVAGQYQYDALGRRVQKITDPAGTAVTTLYFYDNTRIVEEQNSGGATQATYVYGNYIDEILTMDRGGETFYYHQNGQWSVEAVTDSSGNPVERYSYDAYGAVTVTDGLFNPIAPNSWGTAHSAIGNPWTFTGRQSDEETGLYFYRARYYDPAKGRFLQRDAPDYRDSMNLYQYTGDNPTNRVDPSGHWGWSTIGAIAGAVAGAVVAVAIVVAVAATAPISVPVLIGAAVIGTAAATVAGGLAAGSLLPPDASVTDKILVGAGAGALASAIVTPAFIFTPGLAAVSEWIGAPIAARFPILGRLLPEVEPTIVGGPVRPPVDTIFRREGWKAAEEFLKQLEARPPIAGPRPPIPPGPTPPPPPPSGPPLPPTRITNPFGPIPPAGGAPLGFIPFIPFLGQPPGTVPTAFGQPPGTDTTTCPLALPLGGPFDSPGSSYPDVMSSSYSMSTGSTP